VEYFQLGLTLDDVLADGRESLGQTLGDTFVVDAGLPRIIGFNFWGLWLR
jgi:hypothetical protein